jgi:hypothetical protein
LQGVPDARLWKRFWKRGRLASLSSALRSRRPPVRRPVCAGALARLILLMNRCERTSLRLFNIQNAGVSLQLLVNTQHTVTARIGGDTTERLARTVGGS